MSMWVNVWFDNILQTKLLWETGIHTLITIAPPTTTKATASYTPLGRSRIADGWLARRVRVMDIQPPTFDRSVIMRKKEFIHIHALLVEVTQYLSETGDMAVEIQSTYDALGVRPSSIHKSKEYHYEAITILGDSITQSLEQAHTDSQGRPVNRPR